MFKLPENIDINNFHGFVYLITFADGTYYIGKKSFFSVRKKKFGKKRIAALTDKRLKHFEMVRTESDWKKYNSSNAVVKQKIADGFKYDKYFLHFAKTKKSLSYQEERYLYTYNVLTDPNALNDNIAGRYFKKDMDGSR